MEPSLSNCHNLLKAAFKADEEDNLHLALKLYTEFVGMTLKCTDPPMKLKVLASQAMDRAEELKETLKEDGYNSCNNSSLDLPNKLNSGGPSAYSAEELKVLEHGSRINKLVVVPFMNIDLKERFIYPIPFSDPDGRLALSPKQTKDAVGWLRISELAEYPQMICNQTVDFVSILQTVVSDCSFVASLSVAAVYESRFKKPLISSILYPQNRHGKPIYNASGKYLVKLHINGVPRKVIVDDQLPVGKFNQLLCSHSKHKDEFWVSILEKSYMKIMGGYDFPGSNSVSSSVLHLQVVSLFDTKCVHCRIST